MPDSTIDTLLGLLEDRLAASGSRPEATPNRKETTMPVSFGLQFLVWLAVMLLGGLVGLGAAAAVGAGLAGAIWLLTFIGAFLAASAVRVASQWERAVVLRLGKFAGLRGPGLFFITPVLDTVPYVIDLRLHTTVFRAEQTMTRDTVPVDVDAVLFWRVVDPQSAALEVANYQQAVSWAAQTALRDIIGRSTLAEMLSERERIDQALREVIDRRTESWGTRVESVEIRDVTIPQALQDAMSRQAQAERERQARVILGESETQIADKFAQAALMYQNNPTALHLRAMNMLYEGLRERGALVIVPSSAVESMNLGGVLGMAAAAGMSTSLQAPEPAPAIPAGARQPAADLLPKAGAAALAESTETTG